MINKSLIAVFVLVLLFVFGCAQEVSHIDNQDDLTTESGDDNDQAIKTTRDGTKYIINPNEFRSGGPGLGGIGQDGGIPALLDPDFIKGETAVYVPEDELVLGIVHKGEARAYPYRILIWHEIVNDVIQDDPILISYCPLCFTGVAFDARIDGKRELFGVSGKLYNSELVMYDQSTQSYWPQSLGKAVVGERTGTTLQKIPIDVATWKDWISKHPDTLVLSKDTGFNRQYTGRNPYGDKGDFSSINLRLGVNNPDPRLPEQEIVYGLQVEDSFTAYPATIFEEVVVINDQVGSKKVVVFFDKELQSPRMFLADVDGTSLTFEKVDENFVDKKTQSVWNTDGIAISGELVGKKMERLAHEPIFWFAWAAFHPETDAYRN